MAKVDQHSRHRAARYILIGWGACLLALSAPATLLAQGYPSPLSNTANVTPPADIGDVVPGNNSATDSNVLAVQAQLSVSKSILGPTTVSAGAQVQYQIQVNNQGPSSAIGVTVTDAVPALLGNVSWTCAPTTPASSCALASGTGNSISVQVNVGVGDSVIVLVTGTAPSATPATIPANTAALILPPGTSDPTPGDNSTSTPAITVQPPALVAVADSFAAAIPAGGGTTPSVLDNDTLAGTGVVAADVIVSLQGAPTGYSIDGNGLISVPAGAPAGRSALTYQICERISPSNCATATATFAVAPSAVNDSYSVAAGTPSYPQTVATNDNAGAGALYSLVGAAPAGLTFNPDGSFVLAPAGGITSAVTFPYQVCLPAPDAGACATASATILVNANPIVAVDDVVSAAFPAGAGGSTAPVTGNDTLAGNPITAPASVLLSLVGAPADYSIAPSGVISVASSAAAGAVVLTYQICEAAVPANCATANVALVVSPDAVDDSVATPGAGQPVSGSVAGNDNTASGSLFSVPTQPTRGTVVMDASGAFTYTPGNGNTGADSFVYQVCLPAPNGAVCDTATVTVQVAANVIDAVDDIISTPLPSAGGTTASVISNDLLNGAVVTAAQVSVTLQGAPNDYSVNTAGQILVAAGAAAGAQLINYQLCEIAAPGNCDIASVQLVVAPDALGDSFTATAGVALQDTLSGNDNPATGGVYSLISGPANGTATVNADGTFGYTALAAYSGQDSFQYQLCLPAPNAAVCDTATATFTVTAALVVANDDDFSATPFSAAGGLTTRVTANDSVNGVAVDPVQTSLSLTGAAPVGFTLQPTGELTVPAGAQAGIVLLAYQLCESGTSNCASANITVVITPDAVDDVLSTNAGRAVSGNVAINDNAPSGSTFSVLGAAPTGLVFSADGSFTYTPPVLFTGAATFDYQVCLPAPEAAVCATASVTINVNAGTLEANDDDFRSLILDATAGGTSNSVLANDTHNGAIPPDPSEVQLTLVGAPTGYSINPNGTISVPGGAAAGQVSFGYQVCETALPSNCSSANVLLLLSPVAANDNFSTQVGVALSNSVASNDNVPAGSAYEVSGTAPAGLVFGTDGNFVYTPPPGTQGAVTFAYQVCLPAPNSTVCTTATVTLNVNAGTLAANDDDFRGAAVDPALGGTTTSVLVNDSLNGSTPPASTAVQLTLVNAPAGYTLAADGTVSVAAGVVAGAVTLTYQMCEAALPSNCDSAQIALLVAPQAQADAFSTPAGQLLAGNVGSNDNAPVGAVFALSGSEPAGLSFNPDGSFLFNPPAGFTGAVTFTYQVCLPAPDSGLCSSGTATISVNAGNLAALSDDFSSTPLAPGDSTATSVLANDTLNAVSPPAAASVTLALVGAPAGYVLDAAGLLQVPASASAGVVQLTYQLCEAAAPDNCASAQITLVVTPQAQDDALSTAAGQLLNGSVADNDNAPAGSQFTVTGTTPDGLLFNGNGSFSYTPPVAVPSPVTFTYQVCLPAPYAALCSTATATININAGTLAAVDDDFTASPVNPATGGSSTSVLLNDSLNGVTPPDAASVLLSLPAAPAGFSIAADGVVSVAAGTQAGAYTLTYQLCEAALPGNCDTATIAMLVAPQAVADAVSTQAGQAVSVNVGSNDNIAADSTFALTTASPAGLVFNADGSFTFTPPVGVVSPVTFSYQVCLPAPNAAQCATAAVTINVNNGALQAVDDDFTGTALLPGGSSASVLANDVLNATTPPASADVVPSLVGAPGGYVINPDGTISVPALAASGRIALTYQLCEAAAPGNCDTAQATLLVTPQPVDDVVSTPAGQSVTGLVGGNDNVPAGASFNVIGATPAGLLFNADGSFSFTPPVGVSSPVTFDYQVCLPAPDAAVCGTASVTINVNNGALSAVADDFSGTPVLPGASTPSVLTNDSLNGATPPAAASVLLSLVGAPAGYVINPDGTISTPAGTLSGAVTLTYQLCEVAAPSNCDSAQVSLVLTPEPVADAVSVLAGQFVSGNVGGNDNVPSGAQFSVTGTAPAGLQFNADGSFSYAPPVGTTGTVTFTYQVCLPAPNGAVCGSATVTITVSNGALLAADDDFSATPMTAGGTTSGSVLANDALNGVSPPAAADVILQLVGAPAGYTLNPDGTISTASTATSGAITLDYTLCEAAAPSNCDTATAALLLTPVPVADVVSTLAGQPVSGDVGGNDNVPAGATFSIVGTPPPGLLFNADGSFTFTPPVGVISPVTFIYQVCLPAPYAATCGTASVTINVNNGALDAVDDDFSGSAVLPGAATPSVLGNDTLNGATPPAAAAVSLSLVGVPAGYAINPDGSISVPTGTVSGPVQLTYQLCEVAAPSNCDSAGVTLLVTPVALDDVVSTSAGQAVAGNVGSNDNMPPGSLYTITGATPAGLLFNTDGSFVYNPPLGVSSPVGFDYQVCLPAPNGAVCSTASVTINVNNGALSAVADDFSGTPLLPGASTPSVLANDSLNGTSPPAPASVLLSLVGAPAGYAINPDGTITTPAGTLSGAVTLTYQLCEVAAPGNCDTASVSLLLTPVPLADTVSVAAGQTVIGNAGSNDNVPPGSQFSVSGATPPGLLFNPDGSFSYTPPVGTTGPVTFTYQVCLPAPDGAVCGTASVTINVNNGTLSAANDDFSGTPLAPGGSTPSVLVNDALNGVSPPAAADVIVRLIGAPAGYAINPDGTITTSVGTPSGALTLTYELCEAAAPSNCDTATAALLLTPVPVADVVSTLAGQPVSGNVGGNDNVPADATFSLIGATPPGLLFNADGSFTFTPPVGVTSPVTFSYQVCLPAPYAATCGTASVTINVNNGALDAVADDFSGSAVLPGAATPSVLVNDTLNGATPPAAAAVSLSLVGAPAGYAINPDGSISVPTGTLSGRVQLTYQLCEAAAPSNCDSADVTLLVAPAPLNDVVSTQAGQAVVGNVGSNDNVPAGAAFSLNGTTPAGLLFNTDGSFVYNPPLGTTGPVSISYQVCLPAPDAAVCGSAILVINVNNGALSAVADDFSGTPLLPGASTPSVLVNDSLNGTSPPAPASVIVSLVGAPAGYAINPDGTITTPAGTLSGAVNLTYQLCEVAAPSNCDTASVSLLLTPVPLADTVSVAAGQTVTGNVGSNDNVPPGSQFSVSGASPPGLLFNPDGSFSYAPPAGTTGTISFSYQVCLPAPNAGICAVTTVSITVGVGSLVAGDDDFSGAPFVPGGTTPSVLANDSLNGATPPAAANVLLSLIAAPAGYAINPDGTISTPSAVVSGAVTLSYQVCEAAAPGNCDSASVLLVLTPVPVADVVSTAVGQPVSGNVGGNDNVPPGSNFSLIGATPPGLVFNADGSFTFSPPLGVVSPVTFSYQVCLPAPYAATCGTAAVTINVNTGTLLAGNDDFSGSPLLPGGVTPSVLTNDTLNGVSPPDPASVLLSLVGAPAGYAINADGTLLVPAGGTSGATSLTYQVCEAAAPGNCASASILLVLAPVPLPDVVSTPAGQPVSGNVGSNDNVPPGSSFSIPGTTPPGLLFNADGSFTYTPPAGTTGQVDFTYQVCLPAPNAAVCGSATVTLNINNGALSALDDDFSGTPLLPGATTPSVLNNDTLNGATPPAAGSVALTLVGAPAGYAINANGTIAIPTGTLSGPVVLTYQVCEAAAPSNCDSAQATLLLTPAPTADSVSVAAGQSASGDVGDNDNVPPGSTFVLVGGAPAGLLFNADGSFSYTPPAGTNGTLSFTYQVCLPAPNAAVCGTASVTLTVATNVVLAVNDDFTATPVDPAVGGTIARSVLDNDTWNGASPPPVGSVTATLTGSTPGYTMNNQGQIMVAPGVQAGQVQLSYQLCENGVPGNCSTAIATVLVQGPVGALLAVDDVGGPLPAGQGATNLLNVFTNDTFNSAPLDPSQVDFAPVATPALSFAADGALSVAAGLTPGTYSTTYTLCLVSQPTVCDTGTVSVSVVAGTDRVDAQDDAIEMPQNGVVEIDVLGNDRMDGNVIDPDWVVLSITTPPPFGTVDVLPRARLRFAVLANFAGLQRFDYQICEAANPSVCATATVSVTVEENVLVLSDDAITAETSGPLVIDVLANDSTRTAALDPASLQVAVAPVHGSVACAAGRCTYTPAGGFFGTDSFRYRICDVSIPTPICGEANVAVTVAGQQATLRLTKTAAKRSAQIGDLVRYTVTIENVGEVDANGATLLDTLPPGFSFVSGGFSVRDADNAARTSGVQPLRIDGIDIAVGESAAVVYYLRVGAGTGTGVHTNRITAIDGQGRSIGNVASADVDISADPLLDESLVVGSVFDDRNGNGVQEPGERGIPGVRVAAVEGLLMETDAYGRYHLVGIQGGGARGRNFILKVDPSTLPAGAGFTTPNPLVRRITPGVPVRFDFGVRMPPGEITAAAAVTERAVIELGNGMFLADAAGLAPGISSVLDKAVQALTARGGGRLLLMAPAGTEALARQRAQALAEAMRSRLAPEVAAATRINVVAGAGDTVLHSLPVDQPPAPADTRREGR